MIGVLTGKGVGSNSQRRCINYLNEFFRLKCAPDILLSGIFPNTKEITESFAAYRATVKFSGFDLRDPEVNVIAVGDGCTPRTAGLFAFMSNWNCYSIDPNLKGNYNIKRLTLIKKKAEDVDFAAKKLAIVCVHSHAPVCLFTAKERFYVNIPCCIMNNPKTEPDYQYYDYSILSPKNEVFVWKRINL